MRHPGLNLLSELHTTLQVSREHRARKPLLCFIGNPQRILLVPGPQNRRDRPKQLLSSHGHIVSNLTEHVRRQNEPPRFTTEQLPCTLLSRLCDPLLKLLQLALIDDRPDNHGRLDGLLKVRILEHDKRTVAPQLELDTLDDLRLRSQLRVRGPGRQMNRRALAGAITLSVTQCSGQGRVNLGEADTFVAGPPLVSHNALRP